MQGSVEDRNLQKWKNILQIGHVYIFKNVIITQHPRQFKLVPTEYKMTIRENSDVRRIDVNVSIPRMKRYITTLSDIGKLGTKNDRLTGLCNLLLTSDYKL